MESLIEFYNAWVAKQCPVALELFRKYVNGRNLVGNPEDLSFEAVEETRDTPGDTTLRWIVKIRYSVEG